MTIISADPAAGSGATGPDVALPLVVTSDGPDDGVVDRIRRHRESLRGALVEHGAILLRGSDIGGVGGFDAVVRALLGRTAGIPRVLLDVQHDQGAGLHRY